MRALGGVEVEGEEVQTALGDRGRVLRPHRARGGVARVDQRLVGVRLVVGRERRAQHHRLATHLDAAARVELRGHAVRERAHEHGHVVAGRPVAARDRPRQAPVLVHQRQREPVELGHHDHRLAGEAAEERLTCSGLVALSSESIGRECRIGACRTDGAPTCSSGFGSGASSGCSPISARSSSSIASYSASATDGDAAVVRVAQRRDLVGEFLDRSRCSRP